MSNSDRRMKIIMMITVIVSSITTARRERGKHIVEVDHIT